MQEQSTVGFVKQKDRKGAMENAVGLFLAKHVRFFLGSGTNDLVLVIDHEHGIAFHEIVLGEPLRPVIVSRRHAVVW